MSETCELPHSRWRTSGPGGCWSSWADAHALQISTFVQQRSDLNLQPADLASWPHTKDPDQSLTMSMMESVIYPFILRWWGWYRTHSLGVMVEIAQHYKLIHLTVWSLSFLVSSIQRSSDLIQLVLWWLFLWFKCVGDKILLKEWFLPAAPLNHMLNGVLVFHWSFLNNHITSLSSMHFLKSPP